MKTKNSKKRKITKSSLILGKSFIFTLVVMLLMASCSKDDDGEDHSQLDKTIAVILKTNPSATQFTKALERSEVLGTLGGTQKYTVFVPNDLAFNDYLKKNSYANVNAIPKEELKTLMLNHMVPTSVLKTSDLAKLDKKYITSGANLSLFIGLDNQKVVINGAAKLDDKNVNINAKNGVVHIVNSVIVLPTVATFLELDKQFSSFYKGLTTATPQTDFITTLKSLKSSNSTLAPFSIFAPNEAAITSYLKTNSSWKKVEDIPENILTPVLKHHIVTLKMIAKKDLEGSLDTVKTWEGADLKFTKTNNKITIKDGAGNENHNIAQFDIKTQNGIIHVVESILQPIASK